MEITTIVQRVREQLHWPVDYIYIKSIVQNSNKWFTLTFLRKLRYNDFEFQVLGFYKNNTISIVDIKCKTVRHND